MFELYVCVGMYLGFCGQIHHIQFDTIEECKAELTDVRKMKDVAIAYCFKNAPSSSAGKGESQ
jgi:hypothetical protein